MNLKRKLLTLGCLLAAVLLACGGDSDTPGPTPSPRPEMATPTETQVALTPLREPTEETPAEAALGRIAFSSYPSMQDYTPTIQVINADGSGRVGLTDLPGPDYSPAWSPDGLRIAFGSTRDDPAHPLIYIMNADGSDQRKLTDGLGHDGDPAWSPDGSLVAFSRGASETPANKRSTS